MVPSEKASPGEADWVTIFATPERSVAVGSTQNAIAEVIPSSIFNSILSGQFEITGGVLSAARKQN